MAIDEDTGKRFPSTWSLSSKLCDSCKTSTALLFCRADSAFLCITCDSKIHAANKLASRHERVWMCEVCEQAPASVTCKADAAALCVSCDRDIHSANPLARRHERVPVVPFYESAASALKSSAGNLLVPDDNNEEEERKRGEEDDEAASWLLSNPNPKLMDHQTPDLNCSDQYFFSEVDPYLDLDHYAPSIPAGRFQHQQQHQNGGSGNGARGTTDSVVPVQSEPHRSALLNPDLDFCAAAKPSYSYNTASLSQSVSSSSMDVGVVPDGAMTDISNPYISNGVEYTAGMATGVVNQPCQLTGMDREARVMRYREKRKNRKFEKTIRYASRKAYAETRPRIKGRFAKRTELEAEVDRLYSSAASLMADASGYGIVPSY